MAISHPFQPLLVNVLSNRFPEFKLFSLESSLPATHSYSNVLLGGITGVDKRSFNC